MKRDKLAVERTVLKLTAENRKLKVRSLLTHMQLMSKNFYFLLIVSG